MRAATRIGWRRLTFALAMIWSLIEVPLYLRPDLLRPTDFGSDTSNYFASAQRMLDGHPLYELTAGDRPAPADNPPYWKVPILSPPSLSPAFVPLALLPGPGGMVVWWATCFAAALALAAFLAIRAPPVVLGFGAPLAILNAITAWSGNVNAILPGMLVLVWLWAGREQAGPTELTGAGVLIAVGAALKLGPLVFLPWFLGRGQFRAATSAVLTLAAIGFAVVAAQGLEAVGAYLDASADIMRQATPLSPIGLAKSVGLPAGIAASTPYLMVAISSVFSLFWKQAPRATFAVATAVSVLASPVVRPESFALLIVCAVPWATQGRSQRRPPLRTVVGIVLALSVAIAVVAAVVAGGLRQSTVSIENRSNTLEIVRFQVTEQPGTFGFALKPGEAGLAWSNLWGTVFQPVLVFDESCRLLGTTEVANGSSIILTNTGIGHGPPLTGRPLPFNSTCAGRRVSE
jgi:hypothetical protein